MTTSNDEGFISLLTEAGSVENSVTKSAEWDYSSSKIRIVEHLYVRDLMENGNPLSGTRQSNSSVIYDNYQLLASEFDFSEKPRVCALGGLVSYLQKNVFTMEQHGHVHVRSLAPLESLVSGHCVIDPVSLRALSIFVEDFHPSQVTIYETMIT
jgi:DNA mismatch repair ATPase MutS